MMDPKVLSECEKLSHSGKGKFPEVVGKLAANGVERYCADLVSLAKFYYSADGKAETVPMLFRGAPIAKEWSANAVRAAIRDSQIGEIDYPQFLDRICAAGCVYYDVFITGRKAIYTGRNGDFHVESFPSAK